MGGPRSSVVKLSRVFFSFSTRAIMLGQALRTARSQVAEITNSVFEPACCMVKCDPRHGKYMACAAGSKGSSDE